MDEHEWLAERFQADRTRLQAVAYRILGSLSEADDAVQEAWLRLSHSDSSAIENLGGWLTTVVARICLDMLRSRRSRHETPLGVQMQEAILSREEMADREHEVLLADSVGLALLVVLDSLTPAQRLAFVLHDMFALPFEEIAPIVGRSPTATRQLASRARRRVQGAAMASSTDLAHQREVVDAFLAAIRDGDFDALLAVLDPDIVLRDDSTTLPAGVSQEVRGAAAVAERSVKGRARSAQPALINGSVGVVVAPRGRLHMVIRLIVVRGKIAEIDVITAPERLRQLDLAVLND